MYNTPVYIGATTRIFIEDEGLQLRDQPTLHRSSRIRELKWILL